MLQNGVGSKTRFVLIWSCCLVFERSELRKHSDLGLEPVCGGAVVPATSW